MKKSMFALTAMASVLLAAPLQADEDWGIEEGEDTAVLDIGGCNAPYSTDYKGSVLANNSSAELGTVFVREARGAKRGSSNITILTYLGKKTVRYFANSVLIPGAFTATSTDGKNKKIHFVITWDYFAGTDDSGNQILAADDGNIENIVIDPKIALIGYHTLAFEAISQTNDVDSTSLGYVAVSLNIKKTGKYSASVKMPNGWSFSASGKVTSDGTNTFCKVSRNRFSGGGRESVAFTIAVNNLNQSVSVKDVSDWISTSKKWPINATLEFVAGGNSDMTSSEYKALSKEIVGGTEELTLKTTTLKQKTGLVSGTFYYYVVNNKGKLKRKTGKIVGVNVNGEVYGSAYATNLWSYPFEASAPDTDD